MARRDALLRLHKTLLARSAYLRKKLADELANLRNCNGGDSTGDSADVAFDTSSDEMSSQLAELDARELSQIERALARLQRGTFGSCEGGSGNCQNRIPAARLNALPCTTFCIHCEREIEKHPDWQGRRGPDNWGRVLDLEASMESRRINLSELEMGQSSNR
jgi:DnaK suppressor protein